MKVFTETQLEEIEISIIDTIDENLNYMCVENRRDLIEMLLDDLGIRYDENR